MTYRTTRPTLAQWIKQHARRLDSCAASIDNTCNGAIMTYRTAAQRVALYLQRRAVSGAAPDSPAMWNLSARVVLARSVC
ncbi:MAG: hypothetical protein WC736_14710 [Gallionella sp.]|jgi:hypothetical protein